MKKRTKRSSKNLNSKDNVLKTGEMLVFNLIILSLKIDLKFKIPIL